MVKKIFYHVIAKAKKTTTTTTNDVKQTKRLDKYLTHVKLKKKKNRKI